MPIRLILLCGFLTGLSVYLLWSLLDWWQITLPRHGVPALINGVCAGLIFWGVPQLLRRRN